MSTSFRSSQAPLITQQPVPSTAQPAASPLKPTYEPDHTLANQALAYSLLGWRVVPCHTPELVNGTVRCSCRHYKCGSVGKHPRTPNGLRDATTDAAQIALWWGQWPDANIAIVLGDRIALDIDPRHGGNLALLPLQPNDLNTPIQITGSCGLHLIYWQPPGRTLGNGRGALPPGVDVRGGSGYIIAAPSLHANGSYYQWALDPWLTAPQNLPASILALIDHKCRPDVSTSRRPAPAPAAALSCKRVAAFIDGALNYQVNLLALAPDGSKHVTLLKAAVSLGGLVHLGLDEQVIFDVLYRAIFPRAADPSNAEKTILDGIKYGKTIPRNIPERDIDTSASGSASPTFAARYGFRSI